MSDKDQNKIPPGGLPDNQSDLNDTLPPTKASVEDSVETNAGQTDAAPASPSTEESLVGRTFGGYKILRRLGNGGMATVYAGYQTSMQRDVAIKIMRKELTLVDPTFFSRFEREARITASLEHARILPVIDFGQDSGNVYLVMRLLNESLYEYMIRRAPLSLEEISRILTQIADALSYAHEHSVIHRDLKPANVMMDNQGNCYLGDFGIAFLGTATSALTAQGVFVGTPVYMSPEQVAGESATAASDIYALGVMLFEMVCGRLPFSGETPFIIMNHHLQTPPPMPSRWRHNLPDAAQAVVLKALAKDPKARYQSAREMAAAFAWAIAHPDAQPDDLSTAAFPGGVAPAPADAHEDTFVGAKPDAGSARRAPITGMPRPTRTAAPETATGPVMPTAEAEAEPEPVAKPVRKSRRKLWIGLVAVVIVLAIAGGVVYALSQHHDPAEATALNDAGVKALAKVDYTTAISDFKQAIAIDPNNAAAYFNIGVAYEESGDTTNALQSYQKAISLNDRLLLVRYRLAEMLLDNNQVDQAFQIIDLGVRILQQGGVIVDDASRQQLTFYLYTTRGRAYEMRYETGKNKDDLTLAEGDLLQALSQKDAVTAPAEASYYLAKVYDAEGKTDAAQNAWLDVLATADPLNARERQWAAEADNRVNGPSTDATQAATQSSQ